MREMSTHHRNAKVNAEHACQVYGEQEREDLNLHLAGCSLFNLTPLRVDFSDLAEGNRLAKFLRFKVLKGGFLEFDIEDR
jgi:hypothetical protein